MSSDDLASLVETINKEQLPVHGILVIRNGAIVLDVSFAPIRREALHDISSATESIISTLVGIALNSGALKSLDQKVLEFFPEKAAKAGPRLQRLTIEDLLTMRSGLDCGGAVGSDFFVIKEMTGSLDWTDYVLSRNFTDEPRSVFRHCGLNTQLLCAILRKATGQNALEYARTRLFEPLGITEFDWPTDVVSGDPYGFGGLALTRYDLARIGYLYLNEGVWNGQRVISGSWVKQAISPKVSVSDLGPLNGYGLHWWTGAHGMFGAIGRGDQWLAVLPKERLVVVLTGAGGGKDTIRKAELLGRILHSIKSGQAIPRNRSAQERLEQAILRAENAPPCNGVKVASKLPDTARFIANVRYLITPNQLGINAITVQFPSNDVAMIDIELPLEATMRVVAGLDGEWRHFIGRRGYYARAKAKWADENTLVAEVDELTLINRFTITLGFRGKRVLLRVEEASGIPSVSAEGIPDSVP